MSESDAINVLLIEDDEADAILFQRSLVGVSSNYRAQVCENLADGLSWLAENPCNVVLLDFSLPDSFGLEGIGSIHKAFPDVPIVMLTGLDDDQIAMDALENGAQDYLIKGETTPRELERTLRHAIQRQQILNENRRLMKELHAAARSDALTGVYNRHAMIEEFEKQWNASVTGGRPLSCAILDVDFFKKVNDQYGHLAGDEVLRSVAQMICAETRPGDFIARYGGEEFCVILVGATETQAVGWAERMRAKLASTPIKLSDGTLIVTASFGVAQRTDDTPSIEALIDMADRSLMLAKTSGRDRVQAHSGETASPTLNKSLQVDSVWNLRNGSPQSS